MLNIVDDVTRECLAAMPDTAISGRSVVRELIALMREVIKGIKFRGVEIIEDQSNRAA